MEEKAKRGEVEIAIKIDGEKIDSKVSHVYFGLKLIPTRIMFVQSWSNMCFYEMKNLQSDK
jgi:hypothetical protein